jgi:hypothetical protein
MPPTSHNVHGHQTMLAIYILIQNPKPINFNFNRTLIRESSDEVINIGKVG